MTLPLLSNTVTYGLWWQETNQMIGILNLLTDGVLTVNGALVFSNAQFSISSPSANIGNSLSLTSASGNSLFLLSSNAVMNGTVYITGNNTGLIVSANANVQQNLNVTQNTYTNNLIVYQTELANNILANTIAVTGNTLTNNLVCNTLYSNTNSKFLNIYSNNIVIANVGNIASGLGVTGGLTSDFANLNFITSNNTVQIYSNPSINTSGEIRSTLYQGTGVGQFRAVQANSAIIFRNDGNNFSILTTGNVSSSNAYSNSYNQLIPFQFNVNTGAILIDGTNSGTTFNGSLTIAGGATHTGNVIVSSTLNANGSGISLYVANSTFLNGSVIANSTLTINNNLIVNGSSNLNSPLAVFANSDFYNPTIHHSTLSVLGTSTFSANITSQGINALQGITASASGVGLVATSGEVQGVGTSTGGQFRAVSGNFGVIFRNDGTSFFLLQTPATTTPFTSTWNSFRPFYWNLSTGAIAIDGTASGTTFGGAIGAIGNITTSGYLAASGSFTGSSTGCYMIQSGIASSPGAWSFGIGVNATAGMAATGFLTVSDIRTKTNIQDISEEEAINWVQKAKPKTFLLKDKPSAGFIAQEELLTERYTSILMFPDDDERFSKSDGFSPDGYKLTKDYNHDIPYLTAALQIALNKINALEEKLNTLGTIK